MVGPTTNSIKNTYFGAKVHQEDLRRACWGLGSRPSQNRSPGVLRSHDLKFGDVLWTKYFPEGNGWWGLSYPRALSAQTILTVGRKVYERTYLRLFGASALGFYATPAQKKVRIHFPQLPWNEQGSANSGSGQDSLQVPQGECQACLGVS